MTLISILVFVVIAAFASLARLTRTDPLRARRAVRNTGRVLGTLGEFFLAGSKTATRWQQPVPAGRSIGRHPSPEDELGPEDE